MPYCAYCGREVSERAVACPECGHPRAVVPDEPDRVTRMLVPVARSPWAIAAGYLALLGIVIFPLAPFGLICGLLAVRDIRHNERVHGMGRAIFGIVVGAGWILAFVVFAIWGAFH